jgi:hypothetical protein
VHLGATADVLGLRIAEVPPALVDAIVEQHPRVHGKEPLLALLADEGATKPYSDIARLTRDVALLDLVASGPLS